jgi:hydrogenase maturation protein HypF
VAFDSGPSAIERRRIVVEGTVQGVGFRPFVHRLAGRHRLGGFVLNDGRGVVVEVEGERPALLSFTDELTTAAPPLAQVESLASEPLPARGDSAFRIEASASGPATALVPADVATCEPCLRELWDPADRRHRYPFINCTQCGPRFTIVRRPPYDRANTTMARFEMCELCRSEYEDPADRRFHAEPIACPGCGPELALEDQTGESALKRALELLRAGAIVAVKGLGGYHLACDASSEAAVARLRVRKRREQKPFALISADPTQLAELDEQELELIGSAARPIVLARRAPGASLAPSVAPASSWLGVMLPYTPLHHLLCAELGRTLVMTSGNRSDEPIATGDQEARERLTGIADAFLAHNRPIHRRCEDSVVRAGFVVRRSRGYAPGPLRIGRRALGPGRSPAQPIVATGAELKSTFCVLRGERAFLSPHLGDLDSPPAYAAFRSDIGLYLEMLGVRPALIAHDLHPDYLSTRWALEQEAAERVAVQHHHAHAAACLAENGEGRPALALVFDGTGYGPDGTLWGGELLRCDLGGYERLAHLDPVPLPGGEQAIREPWRMAAAYLEAAGRPVPFERWPQVRQSLAVNAPLSSGMGRLFDAAAALLGVRERVGYEGQAAIELEQLAGSAQAEPYPCRLQGGRILGADLIGAAHDDLDAGRPREQVAAAFHEGVAAVAAGACAEAPGRHTVVALSGGSFQNLRLLRGIRSRLQGLGFEVLSHRQVPPNDGGISFGQAAVAAARSVRGCA